MILIDDVDIKNDGLKFYFSGSESFTSSTCYVWLEMHNNKLFQLISFFNSNAPSSLATVHFFFFLLSYEGAKYSVQFLEWTLLLLSLYSWVML